MGNDVLGLPMSAWAVRIHAGIAQNKVRENQLMSLRDVYIGKAKSDGFDFDMKGDYNGNEPDPAYVIPKPMGNADE